MIDLEEFKEFSPCQDGGIAAWLFEHGDSGCGDAHWPKSILYVAGWGIGSATLNGEPLYQDYQIHFMVTQGMRDRNLVAHYPLQGKKSQAGAVNPALQQLDFYIRSPETNAANHSQPRGVRPLLRDGSHLEVAESDIAGLRWVYLFSAMIPIMGGGDRNVPESRSRTRHSASNAHRSASVNKPASTNSGT